MKLLFVNTYDIDGGAAKAAHRLFEGMKRNGHMAKLLVQEKKIKDGDVLVFTEGLKIKLLKRIGRKFDQMMLGKYLQRKSQIFSLSYIGSQDLRHINKSNTDIMHLHWTANNFISIEQLANIQIPIVWTLHDQWPFTGGCHYSGECSAYLDDCGNCPILNSGDKQDLSNWIHKLKKKYWSKLNPAIITPSRWLGKLAKNSSLFRNLRVECIPNGIDTGLFKPNDKFASRNLLRLPKDKILVAFGAMDATSDKRKGFHLLLEAIKNLTRKNKDIEVVIFGSKQPDSVPDFGTKAHYCGHLGDEYSLISVFSAADVFVAPSLEENLSNAVMESLSCATPVVAFNIGGMSDMIEHLQNGYLAQPFEINDLADGIEWTLSDNKRRHELGLRARKKVEDEFKLEKVVERYENVYRSLKNDQA